MRGAPATGSAEAVHVPAVVVSVAVPGAVVVPVNPGACRVVCVRRRRRRSLRVARDRNAIDPRFTVSASACRAHRHSPLVPNARYSRSQAISISFTRISSPATTVS